MRLSNWCILFMALILGMSLLPDISGQYERNAQYTMEMYHRNVDRATEDALIDQVIEEYEDGSIALDEKQIKDAFLEQVALAFDLNTEEERHAAEELFLLQEVVSQKEGLTEEERILYAKKMEDLLAQNTKLQGLSYCMLFPVTEESESWSNPINNDSFYTFMELYDEGNYGWSHIFEGEQFRYSFSGAKIRKMVENVEEEINGS